MAFSIDLADRYVKTVIDFWRLRPRRFFPALDTSSTRYLTAPQFLAVSIGLMFAVYAASYALTSTALERAGAGELIESPDAEALRIVVFFLANLVAATLFLRGISRVWPIKGSATFESIFKLQCYMMAIFVPVAAVDLLVGPIMAEMIVRGFISETSILINISAGMAIGLLAFILYQVPGVAFLNDTSIGRIYAGLVFWVVALGLAGGVLSFVASVIFFA